MRSNLNLINQVISCTPEDSQALDALRTLRSRFLAEDIAERCKLPPVPTLILSALQATPGRMVPQVELRELLEAAGYAATVGSVWVNIRRIREALEVHGERGRVLTVHGVGYVWTEGDETDVKN